MMPDHNPSQPSALTALLSRASVSPSRLGPPAPDAFQLDLAVAAGLRAPDHGGLRPWHFRMISGEARARWGNVLAESLARRMPDTPPERLALERGKPLRAPLVIAAGAALRHGHRIPVWEQKATAAAGIMNLLNALHLQGFGAVWLSSSALEDPLVKHSLGLREGDVLLGWLYVGTLAAPVAPVARPDPSGFWSTWR
jgi:nitroreductase